MTDEPNLLFQQDSGHRTYVAFSGPALGTVTEIATIATATITTLNNRATAAAKRIFTLSVRPIAISAIGDRPCIPLRPVKIAAEIATPIAAPREEAILWMPDADPTASSGTFDTAASV